MFKIALYFFGPRDEAEVSDSLRAAFPNLRFIDGQRWPTAEPPVADGIHLCKSSLVYLWPADLAPRLPSLLVPTGPFQGPSAGPVIQYIRCRLADGRLEMAQLSATISDPSSPLGKWHKRAVAFLKKRYRCGLDCYDASGAVLNSNLRHYLVGKSIQADPTGSPRMVLNLGRTEYLLPSGG